MEWRDPIDLHRHFKTPGTLAEFQAKQALEDERRKADAEMAYRFANLEMPEDIRSRARAWGMEAFCEVLWNSAFQAGFREAMRGRAEDGMTADEAMSHIRECIAEETRRAEAAETAFAAVTKERDVWEAAAKNHAEWQNQREAELAAEREKNAKLVDVERAARKLEENLGVKGVDVGSLRVDLYRALAAITEAGYG